MPPKKRSAKAKKGQKRKATKESTGGKKSQGSGKRGGRGGKAGMPSDPRFKHVHDDPRFQRMPKKRKMQADSDDRFKSMHTSRDFKLNPRDRYGRSRKQLRRAQEQEDPQEHQLLLQEHNHRDDDGALGDAEVETSSSSDDDDDDDLDLMDDEEEVLEDEKKDIPMGDATSRLAVMHMDWDFIKSVDLLVLFQSFLPPGALIHRVTIYVSQFGKERMKEEAKRGPVGLWKNKNDKAADNEMDGDGGGDEEDEEEGVSTVKLRKYERERLKYYYGVVECDSVGGARKVYRECDGVDFGSTGNQIDLRYIPVGMTFEEEDVRDRATEVPADYEPPRFFTRALSHSKVELSWDRDDPNRVAAMQKLSKFKANQGKKPKDIEVYLASDVESDGEGTDFALSVSDSEASEDGKVVLKRRARSKFQSLLEDLNDGDGKEGGEDNDDQDLRESSREIVFESGLKEAGEEMLRKVQAKKALRDETAWQTTMREKKKKRDARKNTKKSIPNAAAAGAAAADNDDDGEDEDGTHDNLLEDSDDMMAHVADDPFFAPFSTKAKKNKKKNKTSTTKDTTTNDAGDQQDQVKKRMTMELLLMDDDDEGGGGQGRRGYSLRALEDDYEREQNKGQKGGSARKKKKKKKKCGNEDDYEGGTKMSDDFTVNVTDERFKGMFRDPNFAIDPTSPAFKNTKGTHLLIAEGRKQHMDKKKGKKNSHNKARTQQQPKDEDDANAKNRGGSSGVARGIKDAALRSIIGRVKAKQHETTSHHQQAKNKKQNNPKSTMTMLGKKTKKKKKKKKSA